MPWLPQALVQLIAEVGVKIAMELSFNVTRPFTQRKYIDEMQGLADGAGLPAQDIFNINMIAEVIKAQCSLIGANGPATMGSALKGTLAHLRTLDGMGGATMPIKDQAAVTIYHPHPSLNEPAVSNYGWVSFVGSVTGFGEFVGIGEKYWGSGATYNRARGQAWTFVTRDVLTSKSFNEARDKLYNANRTCSFHLGVGSRATNEFRAFELAGDIVLEINDRTLDYPQHRRYPGIVYFDKFGQPTQSYCFSDMFGRLYGNITAERLALDVAPRLGTGDLHAVTMDYASQTVYFANARKTTVTTGGIKACDRRFTRLDMAKLFAEKY